MAAKPDQHPFELPDAYPCVFCERIEGRRDDWAVIEHDDVTVSFVNPRQFEEGQALVIPRRHAPTILDLTEGEAQALMAAVRRLAHAMTEVLKPDGLTLYQNNGVASFQEVPHFHMHVVPRRHDERWGAGPPQLAVLDEAEREGMLQRNMAPIEQQREIADRIKAGLP